MRRRDLGSENCLNHGDATLRAAKYAVNVICKLKSTWLPILSKWLQEVVSTDEIPGCAVVAVSNGMSCLT